MKSSIANLSLISALIAAASLTPLLDAAASPPPKTYTIAAQVTPAHVGDVTGTGPYSSGATVTLTAVTTNDTGCYQFTKWTVGGKTVGTNADYTFEVTGAETVVANFSQLTHKIETVSSPSQGGTVSGGGVKACGSTVSLTAKANSGFKFASWDLNSEPDGTKSPLTFSVTSDATVTAIFTDVAPPKVTIKSPASGLKTSDGIVTVSGTAQDNVAVAELYYQVNSGGTWTLAQQTGDGWATWSAQVSLSPGANVVAVYAKDSSGNTNTPVSVKITYNAPPGFAPPSLAGYLATVTQQGGSGTMDVSFGTSTFVQVPLDTNDSPKAGNYTYTPTGLNTAELDFAPVAPPEHLGDGQPAILTFTSASTAMFTNSDGSVGTAILTTPAATAPASISGATLRISQQQGVIFTNIFSDTNFSSADSLGDSAGTYTYIPYTSVAGMIEEVFNSPSDLANTTNYIVVGFTQTNAGNYALESYADGSQGASTEAIGAFTVLGTAGAPGEIAPVSLDGMIATVTPLTPPGGKPYTVNFSLATLGTTDFANTGHSIGVADYTYTRSGTDTAILSLNFISPPPVSNNETMVALTFTTPAKANFTTPDNTGTITFATAPNNAPESLSGETFSATLSNGEKGKLSFSDGTFTGITTSGSSPASSGTYTYVVYGPSVGMAQLTYTDSADAGLTEYLQLAFTTSASGTFYTTHIDASGDVTTASGTFTAAATPQ